MRPRIFSFCEANSVYTDHCPWHYLLTLGADGANGNLEMKGNVIQPFMDRVMLDKHLGQLRQRQI
ncbi:hypothetical protein SAMN06295970_10512 [Noviherbaspirillum suwonense]|uniref:Uncharacterized protein n=1 Tax=Noviherbaspirillum suwonense TaxID=1224511 RepID=A0ABY1Q653_9BURK|nr:hypothetical protein SAMN06295970_10512 [Noviherbaspirillum suwonense]